MFMSRSKLYGINHIIILVLAFVFFCSCSSPFIHSFTVVPHTITGKDTVQINWNVSGEPTLLYHEKTAQDSTRLIEFTLVVHKKDRDSTRVVQVVRLPAGSSTQIIFSTQLSGDTLVAKGIKNITKWSGFNIVAISSVLSRALMVEHGGKTAILDKDGTLSDVFANMTVAGEWTIKTLLTDAEKLDKSKIPEELKINASIKSIK